MNTYESNLVATSSDSPESSATDKRPHALAEDVCPSPPIPSSPREVIRGESPLVNETETDKPGVIVSTDWLNITFPFVWSEESLDAFLEKFTRVTRNAFGTMTERGRGLHGYSHSVEFQYSGVLFAFGSQRNTAFLSIPGQGCKWIYFPQELIQLFRDELKGRITRWDGAADDRAGIHDVDEAVRLYFLKEFNSGGRRPMCKQHGNWIEPDGTGRTFEIGQRTSGKFMRIYEKGKQLGDPNSPWVRWEVSFGNKDRLIPWEVLLEPAQYIKGAYPALSWVNSTGKIIQTIRKQDTITYERSVYFAKSHVGRVINVMMERNGESAEAVIAQLRRDGVPKRLQSTNDYLRAHGGIDDI